MLVSSRVSSCLLLAALLCLQANGNKLMLGVRKNNPQEIEEAVAAGEDINEIGMGGQTPLVHAVLSGRTAAAKKLLELGADVTITEKDGYNVMHAAAFQGRFEIAKMLIDKGIDPLSEHPDGYYPIHRACWGKEMPHAKTVQVFLDAGINPMLPAGNGKTCIQMTPNQYTKSFILEGMKNDAIRAHQANMQSSLSDAPAEEEPPKEEASEGDASKDEL